LDGRRLKGFVYNFSALKDSCDLFYQENSSKDEAVHVPLKDLKAIFFVKDFAGNPAHHDAIVQEHMRHGRKIEVTCQDGEILTGTTEAFHPQKLGFFLFPPDPESNNLRIFVISKNIRTYRLL